KTLLYFTYETRSATAPVFSRGCGTYMFPHVSKTGLYNTGFSISSQNMQPMNAKTSKFINKK
ncbi:hypothetical protein HGO97_021630, partial [Faecalicatena sp. AGMB00832]